MSFRSLALSSVLVAFSYAASSPRSVVHAGVVNATARLTPRDTSLSINSTNYSTDPILMTYTWPDNHVANAILLKFDLALLPPGAVVQEATLHVALLTADPALDLDYMVTAHKVVNKNPDIEAATGYTADGVSDWTHNGCCYNSVPLAQADIAPPEDSNSIDKIPGYKSWTITTMVQEWRAAPATNLGVLLNSDASKPRDRFRYFASMENPVATLRPYLEVSYSVPVVDTTPPSVTITAPASGANVTNTISVSADAADDIGVAAVQFQLDGVSMGSEDTVAPYSMSLDTTTAGDGSHTLAAVARDATGNQATSAAVSVTVSNSGGSGAVVFEADWGTATGTSTPAVTDGGRWPNYWEFNNGTGVQLLSVVPGGPEGHNALRVQQRGSSFAADLQIDDVLPQSRDYYLRFYMRNDDTSSAGDHVVTVDAWHYQNLTFLRKYSGSADWRFVMSMYGCAEQYPLNHWGPPGRLPRGQWSRFEYFVDFVDANHVQIHPRVYDASGSLLYSDGDFQQQNYGSSRLWNGRNDWTLASYYAAGYSFCVDPTFMNEFAVGNNGQAGASDTGAYWYVAAVQIRTDTWPGSAVSPSQSSLTIPTAIDWPPRLPRPADQFPRIPRKLAVTDFAAVILTVHVLPEDVSQPLQLRSTDPTLGTTVSVTFESAVNDAVQVLPQLMPAGLDVIVPPPSPDLVTVSG